MNDFAKSNDFYLNTCKTMYERMINTVPRDVTLTEVITPIPVKPSNIRLEVIDDGANLALFGQIRVS